MLNSSDNSFFNISNSSIDIYKSTTESAVKLVPRPWDFGEITLLILLIFGTIGNALTIAVMRTKRMRNSNAAMFIISMAISDIILLVLKFTANMIKIYRIPIYNFCIVIQVIPQAASFISVWLIVITSAERTCAVLMPLKVAYLFSKRHSKILLSIMFAFFIALAATVSLCIHYSKTQPYYCVIRGSMEGSCFTYYTYIFPWLKSAFGSWLPSVIGIVLNVVIIIELFRASNARRGITNNHNNNNVNKRISEVNCGNRARFLSAAAADHQSLVPLSASRRRLSANSIMKGPRSTMTLDLDDETQLKRMSFEFDESRMICNRNKPVISSSGKSVVMVEGVGDGGNTSPHHLNGHAISSRNSSHGGHSVSNYSKEKQITIMLLTAAISFIVLTLPYSTFELLRKIGVNRKWLKNRNIMRAFMMLIDINHATNFILYCATGQRFRTELKAILCCERTCKRGSNRSKVPLPNLNYNYRNSIYNKNNPRLSSLAAIQQVNGGINECNPNAIILGKKSVEIY